MSTTLVPPTTAPAAGAPRRSATLALLRAEARLYLREPGGVFFALAFPAVLLVALGALVPGMRERFPGSAGYRLLDLFVPIALGLAIATVSLTSLPSVFGAYRERGVLRRLSASPVPASRLLVVQLVVNAAALVVAVGLALGLAWAVHGVAMPHQPGVAVGAFVLGATAMLALGCVLAAVVRTAAMANGLGMLLYFPMLFFAGVWTPGPSMPEGIARIATFVPLGAATQALTQAWFGDGMPARQLVVLTAWTLVLTPLAARLFRWT